MLHGYYDHSTNRVVLSPQLVAYQRDQAEAMRQEYADGRHIGHLQALALVIAAGVAKFVLGFF